MHTRHEDPETAGRRTGDGATSSAAFTDVALFDSGPPPSDDRLTTRLVPAAVTAQDGPPGSRPRRRPPPHLRILAVGSGAIAVHQLLPARWHELSYAGIEAYILLAMVWAVRRQRPQPARPWRLLTTGLALLVLGDITYNMLALAGAEPFPSVADVAYLASYVVLSWGVISVLHLRRHHGDRTAIVDAMLVTVASAAITWVFLVAPGDYVGVPLLDSLVSAAYPVADVVLLAFLYRLMIAPGSQPPSERLLALGISLLLVADVVYARLALNDAYAVGSWLDAVYHGSYLCFAMAAAHPTMHMLADPEPGYSEKNRSRLWLLAGISLVLPLLAGFQVSDGHERNALILAAASAAAFFLLTFRTGVLNATLAATLHREEDALRRERILRSLGTALVSTQDRRAIFAAAVDHARLLAGDRADALLLFAGDGSELVATASDRRCLPRSGLVLDRGLPDDVELRLLEGRAVVALPDEESELRALLPAVFIDRPLFVAPVFAGGRLRGALVVVPIEADDQPGRLAAACEAVASAVLLALESAELAERLLDERSEQRFRAMVRNSSDIVLVLRPDGTVRFLTPSVTRALGWEVDELLGRHVTGLVHP